MAAQSAVMGEAFGKHFQYGKRKISAMSNEEFNKLTSADLFDDTLHGFKEMIPMLEQSMRRTEGLQSFVIEQLIRYVRSLPADIIAGFQPQAGEQSSIAGNVVEALGSIANIGGSVSMAEIQNMIRDLIPSVQTAEARRGSQQTTAASSLPPTVARAQPHPQPQPQPSTFIGPQQPPKQLPTQSDIINQLVQKDTRGQPVQKVFGTIRAPSSIRTLWNKYVQQLKALQFILDTTSGAVRNQVTKHKHQVNVANVKNKMRALKAKYNFGNNQQMGFTTMI